MAHRADTGPSLGAKIAHFLRRTESNRRIPTKINERIAEYPSSRPLSPYGRNREIDYDCSSIDRSSIARSTSSKSVRSSASERLENGIWHRPTPQSQCDTEENSSSISKPTSSKNGDFSRNVNYSRNSLDKKQLDVQQLLNLKKQLEQKLADSYEELDEQRSIVCEWKRKFFKLSSECNGLKLMEEEQNSRNMVLEMKQRKFESQFYSLTEELNQERLLKEKVLHEKELINAENNHLQEQICNIKNQLDMKTTQVKTLLKDLEDEAASKSTPDPTFLKKGQILLETKCAQLEAEVDDYASQIKIMETVRQKLEATIEQLRRENKKEALQRDEETEEIRNNAHKKIQALESELENEHALRAALMREKRQLERDISILKEKESTSHKETQATVEKLHRKLDKTKTLLKDAINAPKASPEPLLRHLRNQIEDLEIEKQTLVKAKKNTQAELDEMIETSNQLIKSKKEVEEKLNLVLKEKTQCLIQLDETEEQLTEFLKKYENAVSCLTILQETIDEQADQISFLENCNTTLRKELMENKFQLENLKNMAESSSSSQIKALQMKVKELQAKVELDKLTKTRLENMAARKKEEVEIARKDVERIRGEIEITKKESEVARRDADRARRDAEDLRREMDGYRQMARREERGSQSEVAALSASLAAAQLRIQQLYSALQSNISNGSDMTSDMDSDTLSFADLDE